MWQAIMEYSSEDYNILKYLMGTNKMPYNEVIEWAYAQYTEEGVDDFIEKITLCPDAEDLHYLLASEQHVNGVPSDEFLKGEIISMYKSHKINLGELINRFLYHEDFQFPKEEESQLYLADDYFDWHENPDKVAKPLVELIFARYLPEYEKYAKKFSHK